MGCASSSAAADEGNLSSKGYPTNVFGPNACTPFVVVKTSDPLGKLFINVLTLDTIIPNTKVYVSPLKKDMDAKGEQCHCVDVALHSVMLPQSSKDFDDFFSTVIRIVSKCLVENNAFSAKSSDPCSIVSSSYSTPKVANNYKGTNIYDFTSESTFSEFSFSDPVFKVSSSESSQIDTRVSITDESDLNFLKKFQSPPRTSLKSSVVVQQEVVTPSTEDAKVDKSRKEEEENRELEAEQAKALAELEDAERRQAVELKRLADLEASAEAEAEAAAAVAVPVSNDDASAVVHNSIVHPDVESTTATSESMESSSEPLSADISTNAVQNIAVVDNNVTSVDLLHDNSKDTTDIHSGGASTSTVVINDTKVQVASSEHQLVVETKIFEDTFHRNFTWKYRESFFVLSEQNRSLTWYSESDKKRQESQWFLDQGDTLLSKTDDVDRNYPELLYRIIIKTADPTKKINEEIGPEAKLCLACTDKRKRDDWFEALQTLVSEPTEQQKRDLSLKAEEAHIAQVMKDDIFVLISKGIAQDVQIRISADSAVVHAKGPLNMTTLHYAVAYNQASIAKLFLEAGTDKDAKNDDGKTALDFARDMALTEIVDLLGDTTTPEVKILSTEEQGAVDVTIGSNDAAAEASQNNEIEASPEKHPSVMQSVFNATSTDVAFGSTNDAEASQSVEQPVFNTAGTESTVQAVHSDESAVAHEIEKTPKAPDEAISQSPLQVSSRNLDPVIHTGWAKKQSRKGFFKNWTTRLFVLSARKIDYFADAEMQDRKGEFLLDSTTTAFVDSDRKNQFEIKSNASGSMIIETNSPTEVQEWLIFIKNTVQSYHTNV